MLLDDECLSWSSPCWSLPAVFPVLSFSVVGTRSRWRPMFRLLPDNRSVMNRWSVVEIEPYRRRGKQHVNRDARRRRSRDPRAAFQIYVLSSVAAVINLVTGVIHVVVLHQDPGLHVYRRWWCIHS